MDRLRHASAFLHHIHQFPTTTIMATSKIQEKRYQRALQFITGLGKKQKVLDIGCQSGDFCHELLLLGHEPHGIEIVPELVASARLKYPEMAVTVGNCEVEVPFPDKTYDMVWAGEVIEHIAHTDVFLNEINRVLKVGGHFMLTTPLHNRLKGILIVLFKFEKHFNPEFPHYRFYSRKSLKQVLTRRGFEIVEVDYTGRVPCVANTIFLAARKLATTQIMSEHRA